MWIYSHRGRPGQPENTLAAFEEAIAAGVDGIETDARLTTDGVVVLHHDRNAGESCEIAGATLAEVHAARPVARLDEALARWPDIWWNVEIKTPATAAAAIEVVRRSGCQRVIFTSFWHPVVAAHAPRSDWDWGLIFGARPLSIDPVLQLAEEAVALRAVVWKCEIVDPELLAKTRAAGLRNFVFAVEAANEYGRLAELPVDGVITDEPTVARGQLR